MRTVVKYLRHPEVIKIKFPFPSSVLADRVEDLIHDITHMPEF